MTDKPIPIDLVPFAGMIEGAREFLRVWAKPDGPVTCFMNPVPIGADPAGYGIALVDCVRHGANAYARALNRDVLVPRTAGRFVFGRLIGREEGRLQILPPGPGARQQIVASPPWLARADTLIRQL